MDEKLAERGHEVTVVSARFDKTTPRDEQVINGVRVIRLWAPIRISRGMVMPAYPLASYRLMRIHDVVSIHTPMLETFIYAFWAKLLHRGLVITHHGDLVLPGGTLNRFIEWATFLLYRVTGRAAHSILAYSQDYADHSTYIAPFRDKTSVVHPPIIVPEPDPAAVAALRAAWLADSSGEGRLIGYSGRFVEEKRPDILIRSLDTILKEVPDTKIIFAGQYDIKYEDFYERNADLIARYRDRLIFLGLIADDQKMANFYAACDVLALPSDTECFALVQVEAMRCGTPVVSTDIPGARMVVHKTGMGEVVPPRDPVAMGEAILRVFAEPEKYHKTLEEIDRAFNLDETVDGYESHLRAAADAARKR